MRQEHEPLKRVDVSASEVKKGIMIARLSAASHVIQVIQASSTSRIANASLAISPGTLSVDTDISIGQGPSLAAMGAANALKLAQATKIKPAGSAVAIAAANPVNINSPMVLALPLDPNLGLMLDDPQANLVVLYLGIGAGSGGQNVYGVISRSKLTINGNTVQVPITHWGVYQAVLAADSMTQDSVMPTSDNSVEPLAEAPSQSPADPLALAVTAGANEIDLSWSAGDKLTNGYVVAMTPGGIPPADCKGATESYDPAYSATGLTAAAVYSFRVCAASADVPPLLSKGVTLTVTTPLPSDPSAVKLTPALSAITLSWTANTKVEIAYLQGNTPPASCNEGMQIDAATVGTNTSYIISNLQVGTSYAFRLCSIDNSTPPIASPGATVVGNTLFALPGEVSAPSATSPDSMTVKLTWTPGTGGAVASLISYAPGAAPSSCAAGTVIGPTAGNVGSYAVQGLSANTTYGFRICAVNGNSPPDVSAGMTVSALTQSAAITCDSGTLDDTCTLTSSRTLSNGATIAGKGSLVISAGVAITTVSPQDSISINVLGDLTVYGSIEANVNINAKDVNVASGAVISANGHGQTGGSSSGSAGSGPGAGQGSTICGAGGGYGGNGGGCGSSVVVAGGSAYGSFFTNTQLGSGGGGASGVSGGSGGGSIAISTGNLQIDGAIYANGSAGSSSTGSSGGGSGGGILLNASNYIAGAGSVQALGGAGPSTGGGGGGGGRIVVVVATNSFTGQLQAYGGNATSPATPGGAGTILIQLGNSQVGTLTVDNNLFHGAVTPLDLAQPYTLKTVTVQNQANLVPNSATQSLVIDNLNVTTSGNMNATCMGGVGGAQDQPGSGPGGGAGATNASAMGGGGGGFGGAGSSAYAATGGVTYGSSSSPLQAGSGGGGGDDVSATGGAGGGVIALKVVQSFTVDGRVAADGCSGSTGTTNTSSGGGGGSGGAIWISMTDAASIFGGTGSLSANGGTGGSSGTGAGGGGGGGRIYIQYGTKTFTGTAQAIGATGTYPGSNGSVID